MNANIMKTQLFHKMKHALKGHLCVIERLCEVYFTFRPSVLITTLTYFCPCLLKS